MTDWSVILIKYGFYFSYMKKRVRLLYKEKYSNLQMPYGLQIDDPKGLIRSVLLLDSFVNDW